MVYSLVLALFAPTPTVIRTPFFTGTLCVIVKDSTTHGKHQYTGVELTTVGWQSGEREGKSTDPDTDTTVCPIFFGNLCSIYTFLRLCF